MRRIEQLQGLRLIKFEEVYGGEEGQLFPGLPGAPAPMAPGR